MSAATVLVVDDEQLIRWTLREQLTAHGFDVIEAGSGADALAAFGDTIDLVLLDFKLPDIDGLQVLRQLKELQPTVPVILLTAFASIQTAVEAIKQGAYDYVKKPFELEQLLLTIDKALETTQLRREVKALRARESEPYAFDRIIGESPAMPPSRRCWPRSPPSPASTVLLQGETGTGKDLAAKVIHYNSDRAARPFVNITCSALPEHAARERAVRPRARRLHRRPSAEARPVRAGRRRHRLPRRDRRDECRRCRPSCCASSRRRPSSGWAAPSDIQVDVRVIAATNRNLDPSGARRQVPRGPLLPAERHADHPAAAARARRRRPAAGRPLRRLFNREFKKNVTSVTPAALKALDGYSWPGNVRELRNAVERAMLLTESDVLGPDHFSMLTAPTPITSGFALPGEGVNLELLERDLVVQALQRAQGNQTQAAQLLGMNRDQIRYRLEKFGLDKLGRPMDEKPA